MNPSIYSIVATLVSFIVIMIYYNVAKPDFVMEMKTKKNNNPTTVVEPPVKTFSLRLALVYGLMFSSMIGLVVLGISSILKNYKRNQSETSEMESESESEMSEMF